MTQSGAFETQIQQLSERGNEHEQALENSRKQLSDYQTELNKQREAMIKMNERITQLENENRQLRSELGAANSERIRHLPNMVQTAMSDVVTDIEQGTCIYHNNKKAITEVSVATQQSDTNLHVNSSRKQPLLHDTTRQQQTGKIMGFGSNFYESFGVDHAVNHLRQPTKLNSFETVMLAHPGQNTILINESGKLMKTEMTENGLSEVHMDTAPLFVTGLGTLFAIDSNHRLWSWGYGYQGHGKHDKIIEPKMIESLRHKMIKQISGHEFLNACLTMTGEVYIRDDQDISKKVKSQKSKVMTFCKS